jgi:adenylyltransferase/sulfurtransferase
MNQPAQALDERGLPIGYRFDPDREITPREVKARLDDAQRSGTELLLVDCRRPDEWEITRIDGATLIPLQELPELFDDHLAGHEGDEVIVYCRSGRRSLDFVTSLQRSGFKKARSMAGGVLLWNRDIAPGGPQY